MASSSDSLSRAVARWEWWLTEAALPLWASRGVDRVRGGFFEAIGQDGAPIDAPRRARVVARQIYAFDTAGRMGWIADADELVRHGRDALYGRCIGPDGLTLRSYAADGGGADRGFELYDHAFVLLALATLARTADLAEEAEARALRMIAAMDAYRHPSAGWLNGGASSGALRADPHMHMLEACLALGALPGAAPLWRALADELVDLALRRLIDPNSGALFEHFNGDWSPTADPQLRLIEPGHQFEWAWLLRSWNRAAGDAAVEQAAVRLQAIGETRGVDAGGIVVDSLSADLTVHRSSARLWQQTERIKTAVQQATLAGGGVVDPGVLSAAVEAIGALEPFCATLVAGLWHDRLDEAARPLIAASPASSFYHIIGAIEVCSRALPARAPG